MWPGRSPDPSLLENLREIIQQGLGSEKPCTSPQRPTERLKTTGANVLSATLERLVSSMPKRVLKCAALSGEHIDMKYKKTDEV